VVRAPKNATAANKRFFKVIITNSLQVKMDRRGPGD
jgi:hypothetical protein